MTTRSLLLALCLTGSPLAAQHHATDKGSVILGGTAGYSRSKDFNNDLKFTRLNLHPQVGLFLVNGLAVTADMLFEHLGGDTHLTSWGVGPGLAYYAAGISRRVTPYAFLGFLEVRTKAWTVTAGQSTPGAISHQWNWQGGLGGSWFVDRHVGLVGELFYSKNRYRNDGCPSQCTTRYEEYGLRFGVKAFAN